MPTCRCVSWPFKGRGSVPRMGHGNQGSQMNAPSPFLSLDCNCDEALLRLEGKLAAANLRVVQTFDLQSARLGLDDCPCPHHGTSACDCQMVILLLYGQTGVPATLILHGNGGQTWLSLIDRPGQPAGAEALAIVRGVLAMGAPTIHGPNGLCMSE